MSITAQSLASAYLTQGPVAGASAQQFGPSQLSDLEVALIATATFTGDGSTTSATLNYVDGTATLSFTPSAIFCARIGGNDTAAGIPYAVDNADSGKSCTVNFTVAIANTKTQKIAVIICR